MLKLYLSFRHRNETARKKRERKQSTPPFPIRRAKAEEACEQKDRLTERDDPRDRRGEERGCAKRLRAEGTVSFTVPKEQVEDKGRMVDSQCSRQPMDKRACESMLGCQTHCQTHKHHTGGEQGG